MGGWIGVDNVAHTIRKGWIGVDGVAHEIKKGWVGVNGVARKIYPMYVRHYHVSDSIYDTERDSDERDSGYDTSNTINTTYVTTSGGCYTVPYYSYTKTTYEVVGKNPVAWDNVTTGANGKDLIGSCSTCGASATIRSYTDIDGDGIEEYFDGATVHYCPYKGTPIYGNVTRSYTGTNTSGADSGSVSQLGYTLGCGYSWGELIEDPDS